MRALAALALLAVATAARAGAPLPAGANPCAFDAISADRDPAGLNVRAGPSAAAPVLGRLPRGDSLDPAIGEVSPSFHVIGTRDGWFLIEGAAFDPGYQVRPGGPQLYAGRGWVAGGLIATGLRTPSLKAAPREDSADVVMLSGEADGASFGPSEVGVRRILDCAGAWFRVEVPILSRGVKLTPLAPSDGPEGAIRGWTIGFCTEQLTTCG